MAHHVGHAATDAGHGNNAANLLGILCSSQRDQAAFAMTEQPDALGAGFPCDAADPAARIFGIIVNADLVCISYGCLAAEHSALVDPDARNTVRGERRRQEFVRRRLHAKGIVPVTVGRARSGYDKDDRRAISCVSICSG